MKKAIPWLVLVLLAMALITISHVQPSLLDDDNSFLAKFLGEDFLSTLGFIVTITLASAASLHLELNKLQDVTGLPFTRTRGSVKKSAYTLLVLLGVAVVLVVVKPLLPVNPTVAALANSAALLIIFFNLFVLYALTRTVFSIKTVGQINEAREQQGAAK